MGKKSYQIGYAFEARTRKVLQDNGYYVMRSPGSKSPLDLIAVRNNVVLLVQCKVHRSGMKQADWRKLDEPTKLTGGIPLLCYRLNASKRWKIVFELESGEEYFI